MQSTQKSIYNSSSSSKDPGSQSVLNYPGFSPPTPYDITTRYTLPQQNLFVPLATSLSHTHTPRDCYAYPCSQCAAGTPGTQPAGHNVAHKGELRVYLLRVLHPGKEKTHGEIAIMQDEMLEGAKTDLHK